MGGTPRKFDRQEHDGEPCISRHCEFGPHGDGTQGSSGRRWGGGIDTGASGE